MRPPRAPIVLLTLATAAALVGVPSAAGAAPSELFISEYVEGSSNNKAVEIFNGTGAPVTLNGAYSVEMYFNGSASAGLTIPLTGTIADGDVFVLAQASANATVLAQADQTNGSGWFNGDDALILRHGTMVVDSLGQVGVDPGAEWGAGLTSTADNTLRRKATVDSGDTDTSDAFDPATQWDGFATDTFDGLGSHGDGPVDVPATLTCGPRLITALGTAATRDVTGTDLDDTIVDLDVTRVSPAPAAGAITRTAFTAATGVGGTATATVSASAELPAGDYAVTLTSTDLDATTATCVLQVQVNAQLPVGAVQGPTTDTENGRIDASPLVGRTVDVRGVITQRTLARTAAGTNQHGFFLQSRIGTQDGDPTTSDGIFVFMGGFTTLIGGYRPVVGDEVVVRGRVSEFFNLTELSSSSLVTKLASGVDAEVEVTDAIPPAELAAADVFWERHEGARMRVRAGSQAVSGRDVFGSTADSEIWLVDRDDPLLDRADPYARRVFRDSHPLDDQPGTVDNGNGQRIMLGSQGFKALANDSSVLLPPARTFDTLTADAVGGLSFAFSKYGIQAERVSFAAGPDPSANRPPLPVNRSEEFGVATYNVENLYDFRDDPSDGCDFAGNDGCTGVMPPFDYVPAGADEYNARVASLAHQIVADLRAPDVILVQEAEDQDICAVAGDALSCGTTNADGAPDTVQELALAIAAAGGPAYRAAYDRDGADDRGITAAFLYRTDRVSLAPVSASDPVLGSSSGVSYRSDPLWYNTDVQNPKALNAVLPSDVDNSTGTDGLNVFTRAPEVAKFLVDASPGSAEKSVLWAVSNHYSSTPDERVGQRREQAAYGAAIVNAIEASDPNARVVYGGDLNVFPRPDDPLPGPPPSDQLAPLYDAGLHNLWDDLVAEVPASAYSYVFNGQAQTLDHLFVTDNLDGDLVQVRSTHINADWPAAYDGDGFRGSSDHDPQVARFRSRASLSVGDVSVTEGDSGTTAMVFPVTVSRPLSQPVLICAATLGVTARAGSDYDNLAACATLAAGQTSLTFTVRVRGDKRPELDEQLTLLVAGVPGLRLADPLALGTIRNDD